VQTVTTHKGYLGVVSGAMHLGNYKRREGTPPIRNGDGYAYDAEMRTIRDKKEIPA